MFLLYCLIFLSYLRNADIFLYDKKAIVNSTYETLELKYEEFSNYSFYIEKPIGIYEEFGEYLTFHNISINDALFEYQFSQIVPSLNFHKTVNLMFTDFINESAILIASNMFNTTNITIWMNMTWNKYMKTVEDECPWDDGEYYTESTFLKDYFNRITDNSRWRKICFKYSGYLFYQDQTIGEIKFISTGQFIGIIVAAVIVIISLIASLYFIAKYRYTKDLNKANNSTDECDSYV